MRILHAGVFPIYNPHLISRKYKEIIGNCVYMGEAVWG